MGTDGRSASVCHHKTSRLGWPPQIVHGGKMQVQTPGWVKDAIFYQIFPDRFAKSAKVPKPANLEPWESPPTTYGFKGGDLIGIVEQLPYLESLGITAIYLNPIFQS